jgi:L-ascorbate metabolism protein UlaG (beta-lactamase superfamily)
MIPGAGASRPTQSSDHRFRNPEGGPVRGFGAFLRWKLTSRPEPSPGFIPDVEPSVPPPRVEGSALRATLVNHSTLLLQQAGCNLLTDPIWSERASPVPWAGPRRRRAPGILWDALPRLHAVLLSHNHYDHLDLPTLRRLAARGDSTFIVPAGVAQLLRAKGIRPVHELRWGESMPLAGFTVHAVPALHFSGRGFFDRNRTLWCGYVIESQGGVVYFAADTAFGSHFAAIRQKFGPPRLALLPIGAYEPRWFMSPVHMAPEQALRAHQVLGARASLAIHHGTFQLGDDAVDTPARLLRAATRRPRSFHVLRNGQFLDVP